MAYGDVLTPIIWRCPSPNKRLDLNNRVHSLSGNNRHLAHAKLLVYFTKFFKSYSPPISPAAKPPPPVKHNHLRTIQRLMHPSRGRGPCSRFACNLQSLGGHARDDPSIQANGSSIYCDSLATHHAGHKVPSPRVHNFCSWQQRSFDKYHACAPATAQNLAPQTCSVLE